MELEQRYYGFNAKYIFNPLALRRKDNSGARELRAGGFFEQAFNKGILSVTLGSRFAGSTSRQPSAISPHVSTRLRLGKSTQLVSDWSNAIQ